MFGLGDALAGFKNFNPGNWSPGVRGTPSDVILCEETESGLKKNDKNPSNDQKTKCSLLFENFEKMIFSFFFKILFFIVLTGFGPF